MLEPESHADGVGHGRARSLHPKHQLIEVVRDRNLLGWSFGRTRVIYGAILALLIEGYARHYIDLLVLDFRHVLYGSFQFAPDTAIEAVLNLRNLVRHVEGLGLHLGISITRGVRTHMSPRIGIARVAAFRHLYLVLLGDIRIIAPRRRTLVRTHMSVLERIGRPERRHHRGIVEDGIVPLPCVSGAYHILRTFLSRSEFEPILVHCGVLSAAGHCEVVIIQRPGSLGLRRKDSSPRHCGIGLEHIGLARCETGKCGRESAVVTVSIAAVG